VVNSAQRSRRPPAPKKKSPKKRAKPHRPGRMQRVTVAVLAIVGLAAGSGAAIGGLVSGSGSPKTATPAAQGRAITSDEANRLAVMRLRNYQGTGVHFRTSIVGPDGTLRMDGLVDYRRALGIAQVSGLGSSYTFEWNHQQLAAWPGTATQTTVPAKLPTAKPSIQPLNAGATAVDAVFALMLAMGADRPDDARLLQQNGARRLGSDTLNGVAYDVFSAAQTAALAGTTSDALQYWISADGHLGRLDAHLGGSATATTITVDGPGFHALPARGPLG
jgi:hypothetical protein